MPGPAQSAVMPAIFATGPPKGTFVLKLSRIDGVLPHAKEIKVQAGCLIGLAQLLDDSQQDTIADVNALLQRAEDQYTDLHQLPFEQIVRTISQIKGRRRRQQT